ncbi:MAG: porin family protein [bacterium]|nr:porin family protein [bacterium]
MTLGTNPKVWSILTVTALVTLLCGFSWAQDDSKPLGLAGEWEAITPGPQGDVSHLLKIVETDGQWTGQITGPTGETKDVKNLRVTGNRIKFTIPIPKFNSEANFSGTLNPANDTLAATIEVAQMPGKQELLYNRRETSVKTEDGVERYLVGSGPEGIWFGEVRTADGEYQQVSLTIREDNGEYIITLEDPFVNSVRGQDIKVTETYISFTFRPVGSDYPSHFSGSYIAADDRLTGSFSQRGVSRFIKFHRDPTTIILGKTKDGQIILPARIRHLHNFAVTGRLSYWAAMHMVKDETYNINSITTGQLNFDLSGRWFAMDNFSIFARYYKGGLGFSDEESKLAPFQSLGLNSDSTMKLNGWEFGVTGYLGNAISESMKFNPYLTASFGKATWEVNSSGSGSDIIAIDDRPLEGKDWAAGFGIGTEYEINSSFNLEFEWMWRYFMTEDEFTWVNVDEHWTNTHAWALSLGVTYMFF